MARPIRSKEQFAADFWKWVKKGPGCWEWQRACTHDNYGRIGWGSRKHGRQRLYSTHRVAAWLVGMIDDPIGPKSPYDNNHVLHKCDNPKCCRPDHFFIGSQIDNNSDNYKKGRHVYGEDVINAKLTKKLADEIREKYASGKYYQRELAEKYNVSQTLVSHIILGKVWVYEDKLYKQLREE